MNINQSISIQADFQQKSAVKDAGREYGKNHRQSKELHGPHDSMVQEAGYSEGYFVEISAEGTRKAGESRDTNNEAQKMTNELKGYIKQLEDAHEQGEAAADSANVLIKCMQIAMRIISGDEVPWEDHRYLAEHNPELYAEAMSKRMPKEKPHKHERLSEDEKPDAYDVPDETGDYAHIKSIDLTGVDNNKTGEQSYGEQK